MNHRLSSIILFQLCLRFVCGQDAITDLLPEIGELMLKRASEASKNQRFLGKAPKGASKDSCSVCWDGARMMYSDAVAPNSTVKCSDYDLFARKYLKPSSDYCPLIQSELGELCGCPSCPGICPKGEKLEYPNRIIPFDVNENGIWDDTCSDFNEFIKIDPNGNSGCLAGSKAAQYCGCKTYEPICTPCYNNDEMPDLNKIVTTEDGNMTCGELGFETAETSKDGDVQCAYRQFQGMMDCGCPSIPPMLSSSCSLCFANETLSTSLDPILPDAPSCSELDMMIKFSGSIFAMNDCSVGEMYSAMLNTIGRETCCIAKTGKGGKGKKKGAKREIKNVEEGKRIIAELKKIKMMKK